jgi:hypothetical protein
MTIAYRFIIISLFQISLFEDAIARARRNILAQLSCHGDSSGLAGMRQLSIALPRVVTIRQPSSASSLSTSRTFIDCIPD